MPTREGASQLSSRLFSRAAACAPNATLSTLLDAGWFSHRSPKYYWRHANLQTHMLADVALESNWAICPVSKVGDAVAALARLLNWKTTPTLLHDNSARWTTQQFADFKRRVPWVSVRQYYLEDEAFYERVAAGCIFHASFPPVRRALAPLGFTHV